MKDIETQTCEQCGCRSVVGVEHICKIDRPVAVDGIDAPIELCAHEVPERWPFASKGFHFLTPRQMAQWIKGQSELNKAELMEELSKP